MAAISKKAPAPSKTTGNKAAMTSASKLAPNATNQPQRAAASSLITAVKVKRAVAPTPRAANTLVAAQDPNKPTNSIADGTKSTGTVPLLSSKQQAASKSMHAIELTGASKPVASPSISTSNIPTRVPGPELAMPGSAIIDSRPTTSTSSPSAALMAPTTSQSTMSATDPTANRPISPPMSGTGTHMTANRPRSPTATVNIGSPTATNRSSTTSRPTNTRGIMNPPDNPNPTTAGAMTTMNDRTAEGTSAAATGTLITLESSTITTDNTTRAAISPSTLALRAPNGPRDR